MTCRSGVIRTIHPARHVMFGAPVAPARFAARVLNTAIPSVTHVSRLPPRNRGKPVDMVKLGGLTWDHAICRTYGTSGPK